MSGDWITLTRRTNDPKLAWLQRELQGRGIETRRDGESSHAPILKVREADHDAAWLVLDTVDDLDDDDPRFVPEPEPGFVVGNQRVYYDPADADRDPAGGGWNVIDADPDLAGGIAGRFATFAQAVETAADWALASYQDNNPTRRNR